MHGKWLWTEFGKAADRVGVGIKLRETLSPICGNKFEEGGNNTLHGTCCCLVLVVEGGMTWCWVVSCGFFRYVDKLHMEVSFYCSCRVFPY